MVAVEGSKGERVSMGADGVIVEPIIWASMRVKAPTASIVLDLRV